MYVSVSSVAHDAVTLSVLLCMSYICNRHGPLAFSRLAHPPHPPSRATPLRPSARHQDPRFARPYHASTTQDDGLFETRGFSGVYGAGEGSGFEGCVSSCEWSFASVWLCVCRPGKVELVEQLCA